MYTYICIYVYIQSTAAQINQSRLISRPYLSSVACARWPRHPPPQTGKRKAPWKRELKLSWREAGPFNHYDDKVDSDQ